MKEELSVDFEVFCGSQEDYDAIREAIQELSHVSQNQFEGIKKEKWYNRVFDMVTFSQKGKKRMAEQIGTLAQAQEIFVELLLRLSDQDAIISKMVVKALGDIHRLSEQNNYLFGKVKCLENRLLGIREEMDINKLPEFEKKVLSGCLYFLGNQMDDHSYEQGVYANVIFRYLGIDIQMENPLSGLDRIDMDSKKIILNCCMEYMFLGDPLHPNYNKYEDFIDEFDIGGKSIKEIETRIMSLYNVRGTDGFYTKYQTKKFDEIEDVFSIEFEEETFENTDEEIEMTDEIISSILQIKSGEVKTYHNKNVHLTAYINCEGELYFDHCIIYYNESQAGDEITLAENAKLFITNSTVICKGFDENAFINCEGKNVISFENTIFEDCSHYIYVKDGSKFSMMNCQMHNCFEKFISINAYCEIVCKISDNVIRQDDLKKFHFDNKSWQSILISIYSYGKQVLFSENVIIEEDGFRKAGLQEDDKDNKLTYFDCNNATVKNCSFFGISSGIEAQIYLENEFKNCKKAIDIRNNYSSDERPVVDNCVFENCTDVIFTADNTKITNCQFVDCYNTIISPNGFNGGIDIEFCQFINIKNLLEKNIFGEASCIIFRRGKESASNANYLKKCIFDGVDMVDNFLIAAEGFEKPYGAVTYIEGCDFRNCSTKRKSGKIIKEYLKYDTLFKKNQDFHANRTSGCRGLDKINKESTAAKDVEIRTVSTTGNHIGSALVPVILKS